MTTKMASDLMLQFASRTGLSGTFSPPTRYLWTDAFAVCNFLELHRITGDDRNLKLATDLVDQVHQNLGKFRGDDPLNRMGWLSGLPEEEGKKHPTIAGLRIGKKLPERSPSDYFNDRLEWDRDGQYFHYLTKWMVALVRVGTYLKDVQYITWAAEMAKGIHPKFTYSVRGGKKRMYWKMSTDLSRALVPSMGHHDPLDGFITYQQIQAACEGKCEVDLTAEINDLGLICEGSDWQTDDALGIGGILMDACRVADLYLTQNFRDDIQKKNISEMTVSEIKAELRGYRVDLSQCIERVDLEKLLVECRGGLGLLIQLLRDSEVGLRIFSQSRTLEHPAPFRLAFRELGLAIGVQGIPSVREKMRDHSQVEMIAQKVENYLEMAQKINHFWKEPAHQMVESWKDHLDINAVMLATSILPEGFLQPIQAK